MDVDVCICIICKEPERTKDKLRNSAALETIREYCKIFQRDDVLSLLTPSSVTTVNIHASCQKTIGNEIRKRERNGEKEESSSKMKRRSDENEPFDWKTHCLFCGKKAVEDEKARHPDRPNSSISYPDSCDIKNRLLEICRRPDHLDSDITHIVRGRLMATNDVVADKCRYHRICYKEFCGDGNIISDEAPAKRSGRPTNERQAKNFERLYEWLDVEAELFTLSELHQKMVQLANGTDVYARNNYLRY